MQATLPIGSVLRDRYVIESLLGQGGFGAVYLVKDLRVKGNVYALKEMIEPNRKDQTRKDRIRFIFEGDLLKRLDHRALPRVYRVFEDEAHERAYILMDYINGPNLDKLRQQQPGKRFSLSQVMTIMAPVIDALSYLHSQQPPILHRDIKPANIIAPSPNDAVLVDFDIAKEFDPDSTTTAVRRCSPGYGAPEQYSRGTNTRTDIYGLGATIYTLLTGLVPPDALHRMTLLGAKERDPLIPIDQVIPNIPKNVTGAIHTALSLNSDDRFSTIEQFWQVFDAYATLREVPVPTVVTVLPSPQSPVASAITSEKMPDVMTSLPTKKLESPIRRRKRQGLPIIIALLALFVILASAVGWWSLFGSRQGALSFTPVLNSQPTAKAPVFPSLDPTLVPESTIVGGNVVPALSPASKPPHVIPTPTPTSIPTAVPTPQITPYPTPVPNPYPILVGAYNGTVVDTTATPHISANMNLSSIYQNGGNISGYFTVDPRLKGNGPFTGTVSTNEYIAFVVKGYNGNAPLFFWGYVQANASLQGQYCSLDQSGHCSAYAGASGYWNVYPG